jgi:ferredoxin
MLDGWFGPDVAPLNLAGIIPWVHWRGFVVLALLLVGNLFCMACPFMLVRRPAKRWLGGNIPWPRPLRSKWLALALLVAFFWAYEAFDIWASPWLTAWIVLAYFVGAFVIDGIFRGAAFCKYVCPIGHFHFATSPASPFEVAVRDAGVCASCKTKDCIRGRYADPATKTDLIQNGCELWLFQQRKVGNLDCTFCMECVHACPHDNVGLLVRTPGSELWTDRWRSGVGRLSQRPDFAALVVVLCFVAFLNAFGMITPADRFSIFLESVSGIRSPALATLITFGLGTLATPLLLVTVAAAWTKRWAGDDRSLTAIASRWSFALVPVGFGMWIAHHLMHFLMTGGTLLPVIAARFTDPSTTVPNRHNMVMASLVPEAWVQPITLIALEVGMLASVYVAYRIGVREYGRSAKTLLIALPWMLIAIGLAAVGAWLLVQPMQMRGMLA